MPIGSIVQALAIALIATLGAAQAQAPVKTPPYQPLAAAAPVAPDPQAVQLFADLRTAIAAKDETRLAALLAPDFAALACSTDPTAPCTRKQARRIAGTPVDRLTLALCCGGKDDKSVTPEARKEALFGVLGSLLQEGTPAAAPMFGDTVCDPAIPAIDTRKAKILAKALGLDAATLRLAAAPIDARARPDRTAAVAATLPKGAIVPVVATSAVPVPDGWTAIALPAGGIGFAEGVTLDELAPESACATRGKDGWKLSILVGRQS